MNNHPDTPRPEVQAALKALGIRHFLLGIHDPAFPGLPAEDIGRGSPYTDGSAEFLEFVRSLGFNGIQLGPQGITTPENASPYDGTLFSKNPLSLALLPLTRGPWNLLLPEEMAGYVKELSLPDDRVDPDQARNGIKYFSAEIHRMFRRKKDARLYQAFAQFCREQAAWLERDALYEVLRHEYGGRNWRQWKGGKQARLDKFLFAQPPEYGEEAAGRIKTILRLHDKAIEEYKLIQFLLAEQHKGFRALCHGLGLKVFGDFQIGLSGRDTWYAQSFLLRHYVMGAPPSRTNPEGQPWNYPVFDPRQYYRIDAGDRMEPGAVLNFLRQRILKLLSEYDGLRIDHPHGLVCPWVYRTGRKDQIKAVREGARLFSSPSLADHPELAEFAIARPNQIDVGKRRYDDNRVFSLDPDQVRRYAVLFNEVMASAFRQGRSTDEIACEILSTQPYPIKRVMELYGLGRFRITQKADLDNPSDVYRMENAGPEDWVMAGNHDTPSLRQVTAGWIASGKARQQAAYLAERLGIPEREREGWVERVSADVGELAQAKFADLFVGPARNIMVFFTDLLGIQKAYNKPGTVGPENWSQRIVPDYQKKYMSDLKQNNALDIGKALALALRARGGMNDDRVELIRVLEAWP